MPLKNILKINGKYYPLWGEFVERQNEWIGGTLEDFGDSFDKSLGLSKKSTKITGINLLPNGKTSAFFTVIGLDFSCGFDVEHGGIAPGDEGYLTFESFGGHTWRIKQKI